MILKLGDIEFSDWKPSDHLSNDNFYIRKTITDPFYISKRFIAIRKTSNLKYFVYFSYGFMDDDSKFVKISSLYEEKYKNISFNTVKEAQNNIDNFIKKINKTLGFI